ncbi:hypothetical protein M8J71_10145 [Pseudarthrobacter sp. R1]|uniref:hypothetical protein n=1 Tax=Pseudarthrobacter sp. R1 TaxID=2944934 RepID=UPI00210C83B0|nr:hypothetical protein [Pseudarthrobacter sp. R1]MCQ6270841.1 hypothetical protein [Pseudarthrobacter sp. R1]
MPIQLNYPAVQRRSSILLLVRGSLRAENVVFDGEWQQIAALILLLEVVAAANAFRASR